MNEALLEEEVDEDGYTDVRPVDESSIFKAHKASCIHRK
jgi:hypothetical protein